MEKQIKVLVVEDELQIRRVISMYFKKEGFTVFETENGAHALEMAEKVNPDLMILDIMLPGLSGYDVCKKLKSDEKTKKIIIIILSAKGQEWEKDKGYDVGADLYETKPFSPKNLVLKAKQLLPRI